MLTSLLTTLPPPKKAWIDVLREAPEEDARDVLKGASDEALARLGKTWRFIARREQLAPEGDWFFWAVIAGRGFGKTRSGAEWLVEQHATPDARTAIIAATSRDLIRYCLVGPSGVMSIAPVDKRPHWARSDLRLDWPNGGQTHLFSAEEPDRLRGPNLQKVWADEIASWRYLEETWDMMEMTLRDAEMPQVCGTTTPQPRVHLRKLLADQDTVKTGGHTDENAANVSARWLSRMKRKYEGTRLGRQELAAELLDEAEGALWKRAEIELLRLPPTYVKPSDLAQIVIAVDPAATGMEDSERSSETGIICAGTDASEKGYVLEDLSGRMSPEAWGRVVVSAYHRLRASYVVVEVNNGGDMVENVIKMIDRTVSVRQVRASRGKYARAEPVAALYEQKRIHHCGTFPILEDQLCTWEPISGFRSPDRLDALVWAFTEMMVDHGIETWGAGDIVVATLPSANGGSYHSEANQ